MTLLEAKKREMIKESLEEDDEGEIDHEERLSWVRYKKAGKVNNSPRTNDDFIWLKRSEGGILLPGDPPAPKKTKTGVKERVAKTHRGRGGVRNTEVDNDNRELMKVLKNATN
ncbi:hypothetical protein [Elstera litoralis]|uniref:hypothetical protein n=1 Tax=Elstera litoralis TaxID=552518 RepID=UPI0012ED5266|nr:hypothetical protein [Elstera litoralis]